MAHFEEGFNYRQVSCFVSFKKIGQVSETCHHLMLKISWGHSLTMLQQKIEEIQKSTALHHTSKMEDLIISLPAHKKKREAPSLHDSTSHWLHGNSIPKIGCHYLWPALIGLRKNTLTILTLPQLAVPDKSNFVFCNEPI